MQTIRTSLYSRESGIKESKGFDQNKSISDYNKKVKENLEVLRYVIKVIIFWGLHELPFRGDNEGDFSENRGVFLDMLGLFVLLIHYYNLPQNLQVLLTQTISN